MSGTVQLSKRVGSSLLSTFRQPTPKTNMKSAVKEPSNVDDLPMTTDDEDDEDQPSSSERPLVDSSDEDARSGNIQRTIFKRRTDTSMAANDVNARSSTAKEKDSTGGVGSPSRRRSMRRPKVNKRTKADLEDDAELGNDLSASKKARTASDSLAGEVGAHMRSESLMFGKAAVQRGYGKKSQSSTPHTQLKFKRYSSDLNSPEKKPKLKNKFAAIGSSPAANRKLLHRSKTEQVEFSHLSDELASEEKSDPPRALEGFNKEQKSIRRKGKKGVEEATEFSPVFERPQFKMPDAYNNYAPSAELVDFDVHVEDEAVEKKRQLDPGMALCPMCDEQVDEKLLREFSNGLRMKLVRQVKFCRMHKKVSAQKTWEEKGYPVVDWTSVQARIEGHHDFLKSIILGTGSHFGDLLQQNIKTGQARTLLTTKDYLTPGYYGLRGMSVMTEAVTDAFSNLLRKRAPTDSRISGRGYTGFVQSVLVPELAVKLIQEDLSLGQDQAREVMIESRAVGEILNDEKRHSQPQVAMGRHEESQVGEEDDVKDEDSYDTGSVRLEIEQAADGVSDLSSSPSYSQRPTFSRAQEADDSDSDDSLGSLGGRKTKKYQASMKKQDATSVQSQVSPSSRDVKGPAADKTDEFDDSDGSSSLPSL